MDTSPTSSDLGNLRCSRMSARSAARGSGSTFSCEDCRLHAAPAARQLASARVGGVHPLEAPMCNRRTLEAEKVERVCMDRSRREQERQTPLHNLKSADCSLLI
eukprot:6204729-Prymnesium_polylepis.1